MRYIHEENEFDAVQMVRKIREELDDLWMKDPKEYMKQMEKAGTNMKNKLKALRKAKVA